MSKRLMVLSVGTSLFHSACWDKHNSDFARTLGEEKHRYYCDNWANEGKDQNGGLLHPDKRRRDPSALEEHFKSLLNGQDAQHWPDWLPEKVIPEHALRYSAELATILRFAEDEHEREGIEWQECLALYDFCFVHDGNRDKPSAIAGLHNRSYLQRILAVDDARIWSLPLENFSSTHPKRLGMALREYRKQLKLYKASGYEQIDIVVTGGYKVYGLIAYGMLTTDIFRVLYMHEESQNEVIVHSKDRFQNGVEESDYFPAISE